MSTEIISCPNCGNSNYSPWAQENGFTAVRCNQCRLIYVNPRPLPSLIDEAVQTGAHSSETGGRSALARRVPQAVGKYRYIIESLFPDIARKAVPISWLDVGAGYGEVVEAVTSIAPAGSVIRGVEPMKPKAQNARDRGLDIINDYLRPSEHGPCDYISSINVFSHVPDFNILLSQFNESLKPGGELFLETGNLADLDNRTQFPGELDLPDHLVFSGHAQVKQYLERAGFEIISTKFERIDTIFQFLKNIVKTIMGRDVLLRMPYTSPYRSIFIRARKTS